MGKSKRVLVLVHPFFHPQYGRKRGATEFDVWATLRRLGHQVDVVAAEDSLRGFDRQLTAFNPDVVFNLLEEFRGEGVYDFHLVSHLEALGIPFTGCNPRGLVVSRNKYWTTQVARGSDIEAPASSLGTKSGLFRYPALIKFNREHASMGLTQASVVKSTEELQSCLKRMRRRSEGELIVQEFIEGDEVSVGVLGNQSPKALVPWRLSLPSPRHIATERVKFSAKQRRKLAIRSLRLRDEKLSRKLQVTALKAFRVLDLNGYARFDFRVNKSGDLFLIDVNANPCLAKDEDFARAASGVGISYPELINRIMCLGLSYQPRR